MSEPITVADALKALRMLKEVGEKATDGPWLLDEARVSFSSEESNDNWQEDSAFIVAARSVLPGMVEFLIRYLENLRGAELIPQDLCYPAIAPIVAWAKTREEWSK